MTEQIAKLLKDYLEEINDTMLAEFKWYLSQHTETGARPVQRSQLETSSRTETVDKLVQAFGGDGAVVTAVDILYRMRLNDLATKLAQAKIDRDAEEQQAGEARLRALKLEPDGEQALKAPRDLFCSICLCIFQTPVMLQCGHSFCKTCVQKSWAGKVLRKCPLCEQVMAEAEPQVNFSLKSLSENHTETPARTDNSRQIPPPDVRKKRQEFEKVVNICSSAVEHVKRQSQATEKKIKEEFEKLRRCLKIEKANRLAALKQEETQKIRLIQMIVEMSRNTFLLSDTLKNIEELFTNGSFLMNLKSSLERTQKALLDPELAQVQIDEAKYVDNLQLRVLRKMLKIIKNIPALPEAPAASPRLHPPEAHPEMMVTLKCTYP